MTSNEEIIKAFAKYYQDEKKIPVLSESIYLKVFTDAFNLGRYYNDNFTQNMKENYKELGNNKKEILIRDLNLSTRTRNILLSKYYETAEQVSRLSEEDLRRLRDVGEKVTDEIKKALNNVGLSLSHDTERPLKDKLEEVKIESHIRRYSNVIERLTTESSDSIRNMELTSIFSANDIYFIIKKYGNNLKVKDLYAVASTEFYRSNSYEVVAAVLNKLGIDFSKR